MSEWSDHGAGGGGEVAAEPRVPPRFVPTLTEVLPAEHLPPVWLRADAEIAAPAAEPPAAQTAVPDAPIWTEPPFAPPIAAPHTHTLPPDLADALAARVMARLEARLPALLADWTAGLHAQVLAAAQDALRDEVQPRDRATASDSSSSA